MESNNIDPASLYVIIEKIRTAIKKRLGQWRASGDLLEQCKVAFWSVESDASFGSDSSDQSAECEVFRLRPSFLIGVGPAAPKPGSEPATISADETDFAKIILRLSQFNALELMQDLGSRSRRQLPTIAMESNGIAMNASVEIGDFTVKEYFRPDESLPASQTRTSFRWKLSFPVRITVERIGIDETRVEIIDITFDRPEEDIVVTPLKKPGQ